MERLKGASLGWALALLRKFIDCRQKFYNIGPILYNVLSSFVLRHDMNSRQHLNATTITTVSTIKYAHDDIKMQFVTKIYSEAANKYLSAAVILTVM